LRCPFHLPPPRPSSGGRQVRGLGGRRAGGEGEGERGGDRVAGAGDVRGLVGSGYRNEGRIVRAAIEQRHTAAAARDQHRLAVEALLERLRDLRETSLAVMWRGF